VLRDGLAERALEDGAHVLAQPSPKLTIPEAARATGQATVGRVCSSACWLHGFVAHGHLLGNQRTVTCWATNVICPTEFSSQDDTPLVQDQLEGRDAIAFTAKPVKYSAQSSRALCIAPPLLWRRTLAEAQGC
jgi:hypothetical protein